MLAFGVSSYKGNNPIRPGLQLILMRRKAVDEWAALPQKWPSFTVGEGQPESNCPAPEHLGWETWLSVFSKMDPRCALAPAEGRDCGPTSSSAHRGLPRTPILLSLRQTSPPCPPSGSC